MRPRLTILLLIFVVVIVSFVFYQKRPPSATGVERWGVTFSHQFTSYIDLDWRDVYIKVLDELKPPIVRLPLYWSDVEAKEGEFNFEDYDFLINEAAKRDVELTIVLGMRVPRWPECHVPVWAKSLSVKEQKEEVKDVIIAAVDRYKYEDSIVMWQVENEPFLPFFGDCPPPDGKQVDQEIDIVRLLDDTRPILVTDSGELSLWSPAFKRGDVFGTTMYRSVWSDTISPYIGYFTYPLPPKFFWLKANVNHLLHGKDKRVIVSELQAEPWGPEFSQVMSMTLAEQGITMSHEKFYENIEYASDVGFPDVYLWGVEWWYFMKEREDDPFYWEAAKDIISVNRN